MNRRQAGIFVAAGGAALGLGAWWRAGRALQAQSDARADAAPPGPPAGLPAGPLPEPVRTLDGRTLTSAGLAGRAVVLNFWAPWCPPCVREMPELDRFARSSAARDAVVIGLAIDEEAAVRRFLAQHPVGFPVAVLGYGGLSWAGRLGDEAKALPFSVVYDRSHRLVRRKLGPAGPEDLADWAQGV